MRARLAAAIERAWAREGRGRRGPVTLLRPLAAAYGLAVRVRNRAYDRGVLAVARVPALVVSVGNLVVGGTGKTPATLWIAEELARRGFRVGIVARGYGKRRRGLVVVGEGGGPLVEAGEGGDEAVMLARRFAGPVVTSERRAEAAAHACAAFACDAIVLDDGFQHRALHRDLDVVLLAGDPRRLRLLPAGPLREPVTALRRAHVVLWLGETPPDGLGAVPVFRARSVPEAVVCPEGGRWRTEGLEGLCGASVVAVTGIARPERFPRMLGACGTRVRRHLVFPDHHRYGPGDVRAILDAAGDGPIVTTEKDLVKLERWPQLRAIRAVRVRLEVEDGERLVDRLLAAGGRSAVASRSV